MFNGRKILIAVTGSIAAYKIAYLVRLLVKEKAEVKVIMTEAAKDFITPLTLSTLSKNPVISQPFDPSDGSWNSHVDLGNWADIMIFAPLTANTMAKMVAGIADNFLLAVYLSARCPVFIAPAMDLDMYHHPATMNNLNALVQRGCILIEPQVGELASGLSGEGRMEEPENMIEILKDFFQKKNDLKNKKILITAGPTYEAIDPARYIGNHSSGKMGFALAEAAVKRGAEVYLVAGPTLLKSPSGKVERFDVVSAEQMYKKCMEFFPEMNIIIMAAAVADFTPVQQSATKIKKDTPLKTIEVKPTQDILLDMGSKKRNDQFLVGFALETDREEINAIQKLDNKNLDMIVLNSLKEHGAGFGYSTNKVTVFGKDKSSKLFDLKEKREVAGDIIDEIVKAL